MVIFYAKHLAEMKKTMYNINKLIIYCHENKRRFYGFREFFDRKGHLIMHLIKDENGNLVQHGHGHTHEHTHEDGVTHTHEHTHGEGHDHGHTHEDHACETGHCGSCSEGDCKNETLALLTYMLQHNEHHAQELDQMADNLAKMGMDAACKTIKEAVADFQKGNMRLGLALTLVKEEMK